MCAALREIEKKREKTGSFSIDEMFETSITACLNEHAAKITVRRDYGSILSEKCESAESAPAARPAASAGEHEGRTE